VIAAVVLAAGASSRLGSPKQLAVLRAETLLERAVRVAREAECWPVVVLGASADLILERCSLDGVQVVVNEDWASGMGSSIGCGVRAVGDADGVVVMTCDMPAVSSAHLRALIDCGEVAASGYAGRRGVPAYFPAAFFPELIKLRGDAGAKELLQQARVVELVGGELDVDTAEELQMVQRLLG
jgi:molybdenum cofactor cytidylyltransferase